MTQTSGGGERVGEWRACSSCPVRAIAVAGRRLDRFDALDVMVRWVEQCVLPDSLTATGAAFPGRSRRLCAYHVHYKCQGNPRMRAASNIGRSRCAPLPIGRCLRRRTSRGVTSGSTIRPAAAATRRGLPQ